MNLSPESAEKPLESAKHEIFAREVAKFKTVYDAARTAGYKYGSASFKPNARRLAQRKDIKARIAYLQRISGVTAAIDSAYVQRKLVEIIEVPLDPDDVGTNERLKALELACKLNGLLAPSKIAPVDADGNPAPLQVIEIIKFGDAKDKAAV